MAFIYVITNDINGKQYVGKTNSSIEKRFKEHISDSKCERCENRPLYAAMNKYGIEHFSVEILEECNSEKASEREIRWIQELDTYHNGYNATLGGDSKHYYDYNKLAQSYLELGTIDKVCKRYNCDWETVHIACKECGIKVISSQEQNQKRYGKRVKMIDKDSGEILEVFPSFTSASLAVAGTKYGRPHIKKVCEGKANTAYGYKWEYDIL